MDCAEAKKDTRDKQGGEDGGIAGEGQMFTLSALEAAGDESTGRESIAAEKGKKVVVVTEGRGDEAKGYREDGNRERPSGKRCNGTATNDGGPKEVELLFDGL